MHPTYMAGAATGIIFVATKHVFCRDKSILVATNTCLSSQNILTRHDKSFVAASILLSRQQTCFVATKIILVASPANDRKGSATESEVWCVCVYIPVILHIPALTSPLPSPSLPPTPYPHTLLPLTPLSDPG